MAKRSPDILVQPTMSNYLTDHLQIDPARDAKQISVALGIARFLGDAGIPAVLAGTEIGDVEYPTDHALLFGFNLFGESLVERAENEREPVLVLIAPDGSIFDYSNSDPQGDIPVVSRVEVRGVNVAVAQDCSWLLHKVFAKRPGFERRLCVDGADSKADLIVRGTRPIDEPAIAEIDASNRVLMTFRIVTSHSRL